MISCFVSNFSQVSNHQMRLVEHNSAASINIIVELGGILYASLTLVTSSVFREDAIVLWYPFSFAFQKKKATKDAKRLKYLGLF